jgi:hypothetical protein
MTNIKNMIPWLLEFGNWLLFGPALAGLEFGYWNLIYPP